MTCPSLPFVLGLSVLPVLKPEGFEDADGHCLPLDKRTDADADGREDAPTSMYPFHIAMCRPNQEVASTSEPDETAGDSLMPRSSWRTCSQNTS
jgi:hypothetical protein